MEPIFYPDTATWHALGKRAKSLALLQLKLPNHTFLGYHPSGFSPQTRPSILNTRIKDTRIHLPSTTYSFKDSYDAKPLTAPPPKREGQKRSHKKKPTPTLAPPPVRVLTPKEAKQQLRRDVFRLHFQEKLSGRTIARQLRVTPGTIAGLIHRLKTKALG